MNMNQDLLANLSRYLLLSRNTQKRPLRNGSNPATRAGRGCFLSTFR